MEAETWMDLKKAFLDPADEYTPIPFWFWNDELRSDEIKRQIFDFKCKGVMGFVIHPRIGLPESIGFLSENYLGFMEVAIKEAAKSGMTVFLYDEAMYPSGSAHGKVVEGAPEYASRGLKLLEYKLDQGLKIGKLVSEILEEDKNIGIISLQIVSKLSETEIDPASIRMLPESEDPAKYLTHTGGCNTLLVFVEAYTGGVARGIHFGEDEDEPGAPAYPDVLNPEAVKKFIGIVHEKYYKSFGEYFGNTIKAIFTDEPRPLGKRSPSYFRPWTVAFLQYLEQNGFAEEKLPFLWLDGGNQTGKLRRDFQRLVNQRLAEAFFQQVSGWCCRHGIVLAGHPMKPDDIGLLRSFQIPGQDIVLKRVMPGGSSALEGSESTQAKCSSDSARHTGKRRNLNECFGAYGWELKPDDMKWILDWLFVRGVNMIVPHAFYYSVRGARRDERPPDVGPNNVGWPDYKRLSDYIKRMSWLMTDSINQARVAVLCDSDRLPWKAVKPLYLSQIEFNYLEKDIFLSDRCVISRDEVFIEKQKYGVILIEDSVHPDGESEKKLERFIDSGGKVIVYNSSSSEAGHNKLEGAIEAGSDSEMVAMMDKICGRRIKLSHSCPDLRVSQVKKSFLDFFVIVNEGEDLINTKIYLKTDGRIEKWDPWKGRIEEVIPEKAGCCADSEGGIRVSIDRRESIIFVVSGGCCNV